MFLLRFVFIGLLVWLAYYIFQKMTASARDKDAGDTRGPGNQAPEN